MSDAIALHTRLDNKVQRHGFDHGGIQIEERGSQFVPIKHSTEMDSLDQGIVVGDLSLLHFHISFFCHTHLLYRTVR